jgi:hypothetical protein
MIRLAPAAALLALVALTGGCSPDRPGAAPVGAAATTAPATTAPTTRSSARLMASGRKLAQAVAAQITAPGATASKTTCDDYPAHKFEDRLVGNRGEVVDCRTTITRPSTSHRTGIRVTWDDDHGHFSTREKAR